ncbi:MAG: hypothetical protein IJ748_01415 [Bacteroidales bacterium]|nr:hypothetical protein [Bacteroidales bacterium]
MFSLKRLFYLFLREIASVKKMILSFALELIGAMAVLEFVRYISLPNDTMLKDYMNMFSIIFFILVVVEAAYLPFRPYEKKYSRDRMILLPATELEKWIMYFIIAYIMIPVFTFVFSFIGLEVGILINKLRFTEFTHFYAYTLEAFKDLYFYIGFLSLSSVSFLGAIFFKKYRCTKTWSIVLMLIIIILCILLALMNYLDEEQMNDFGDYIYDTLTDNFFKVFLSIVFVVCNTLSWFCLKKQKS